MKYRTYINIVLLALIIPINELHHLWKDDTRTVNPWLLRDYPLNIQWYMKFFFINVADIIKALLLYRAARLNQVLRIATSVYLFIILTDFAFFFINFNEDNHTLFYSFISLIIVIFSFTKTHNHYKKLNKI